MSTKLKMNFHRLKALHDTAENHDTLKLEYLFSKGFDVNWTNSSNQTALHIAAINNNCNSHYSAIETLLKHGANVNAQDVNGNTALNCLNNKTDVRILQVFLSFQADVNLKNDTGFTPLYNAIDTKDIKLLKLLVDHGADLNMANKFKFPPLHWICMLHCDLDIIKFLLEKGANINSLDFEGRTPLIKLLEYSKASKKKLNFFFKYADINIVDDKRYDILGFTESYIFYKTILEHIAKFKALGLVIHPNIMERISNREEYKEYFDKCTKELVVAQNTKLPNSWITFFDLLVGSKRQLKNYAGNKDLVEIFKTTGCVKKKFPKFSIYRLEMQNKVEKGIKMRRMFDRSAKVLSYEIPIFSPNHLIIRNILDCFIMKDYKMSVSNV